MIGVSTKNMMKIAITFIALFFTQVTWSCSFGSRFNSFLKDPSYRSDKKPSAPIFEVKYIKRGYDDGNGGSCSDAGMITLAPKENPNKFGVTVAYTFKLVEGEFDDSIFPREPVFSRNGKNFTFIWFDGSKVHQEPINIKIEIRAISPSGVESEPSYLRITHPGT